MQVTVFNYNKKTNTQTKKIKKISNMFSKIITTTAVLMATAATTSVMAVPLESRTLASGPLADGASQATAAVPVPVPIEPLARERRQANNGDYCDYVVRNAPCVHKSLLY